MNKDHYRRNQPLPWVFPQHVSQYGPVKESGIVRLHNNVSEQREFTELYCICDFGARQARVSRNYQSMYIVFF